MEGDLNIVPISRFGRSFLNVFNVPYAFKLLYQELQVIKYPDALSLQSDNVDQLTSLIGE